MSPIERPCITDEPMGLPSPEALQVATDVIRRRYVLPETMGRPEVRSECMRLAYLNTKSRADESLKRRTILA